MADFKKLECGARQSLFPSIPARSSIRCRATNRYEPRCRNTRQDCRFCKLGDGRENMHRQAVGLRKVHGDEIDLALHQAADEMHIASEAVELGNDEFRPVEPARGERCSELRPISALAGFNLRELADDFPVASIQVIADRLLLCLKAETGSHYAAGSVKDYINRGGLPSANG
jgi:hypothetical protein